MGNTNLMELLLDEGRLREEVGRAMRVARPTAAAAPGLQPPHWTNPEAMQQQQQLALPSAPHAAPPSGYMRQGALPARGAPHVGQATSAPIGEPGQQRLGGLALMPGYAEDDDFLEDDLSSQEEFTLDDAAVQQIFSRTAI